MIGHVVRGRLIVVAEDDVGVGRDLRLESQPAVLLVLLLASAASAPLFQRRPQGRELTLVFSVRRGTALQRLPAH